MRWLLRLLLGCRHTEMLRERRADGGLDVVCSACGYREPLIWQWRGNPNLPVEKQQ